MASWMVRPRTGRTGRSLRNRRGSEDDHVHLDFTKDVCENTNEILSNICKKQGISEGKKLAYLNAFVKLLSKVKSHSSFGYTKEDIFCCLRVALVNESTQVRAGALRAVRHLVTGERDVVTLIRLRLPYLIARSVDLVLRNETERVQALRLARRILCEAPRLFPPELICCLVCLANGGAEEKDRLFRAALATLAEICVLNPIAFVNCGGVGTLGRNLLDCGAPRVSESLAGCLLHLLDQPETRKEAHVCLHALAAPYCDFHYRHSGSSGNSVADKNREDREMRFNCSRLALLSVLRSWPGVFQFCYPKNTSGLRSIIDILYLRQLDVRKAILDLLYDVLGLHVPPWTDKASVALEAVDPGSHKDSYNLGEGFVVAEAKALLPHLARFRPNIVEIHLAVLLNTLMKCGLLEALVDVIVTSDVFLSIRATILLGEVLHLVHILLPPQCSQLSPGLPNLISYATVGVNKLRSDRGLSEAGEELQLWRQQALSAVSILSRIHAFKERHPTPSSLFLDQLMQFASPSAGANDRAARSKLYQLVMKDGDDAMKESGVLANKDPLFWNWVIIRAVLKNRSEPFKHLDDSAQKTFIRRLVDYFKPSTPNGYGRVTGTGSNDEKSHQRHIQTLVGIELIEFLIEADEAESGKFLGELLADIANNIQSISSSSSAHDALFSPHQMSTSLCRYYFLFLGRLSHHSRGLKALDRAGVFQILLDLVASTTHDCYVKLIISSLDYSIDGVARVILKRALTSPSESCRLYATRFILVLIRSRLPGLHRWVTELLVDQLGDTKSSVSLAAANILSEACDDPEFLERLVSLRPSLLHLGDPGLLLLVRFLSLPSGFNSLHDANFVTNEIQRWTQTNNLKYVRIVEGMIHDALTLHQRGDDGGYSHRISGGGGSSMHTGTNGGASLGMQGSASWAGVAGGGWGFHPRGGGRPLPEVFIPPHLYGQLVQHQKGLDVLVREANLPQLFQVIRMQHCTMDDEILSLKAALWAVGHICTSGLGVSIVESEGIISEMIHCATTCPVYSIRGTTICVLGLVATTRKGADALSRAGWSSIRHHRHEKWPVIEEEAENDESKSGLSDPSKLLWTTWRDETESYSAGPASGPSSAPEHSPLWWGDRHSVDSSCIIQPSSSQIPVTGFNPQAGHAHHPGHPPLHASFSMSSHSSPPHSSSSSLLATSRSHSRMSLSAQGLPPTVSRAPGHDEERTLESARQGSFYIPDDGDSESVGSIGHDDSTHEDLVSKQMGVVDEREIRPKSSTLPSCRPSAAAPSIPGIPVRGQRSNHFRSLSESKGPYVVHPIVGPSGDNAAGNRGSFRLSTTSQGGVGHDGASKLAPESGAGGGAMGAGGGGKSRSNSCTDSTTSGVSSCESAYASRNLAGGGVQTLSPIPSSASLNTLRSTSQPQQARSRKSSEGRSRAGSMQSDRGSIGGTSLSGWVLSMGSGLRGSMGGLSGEGARGFAMLRLLNRSRRPQPTTPHFFSSRTSPSCADLALGRDLLETWVPSRRGIALGLSLSHGIQIRPQNSRALKVRSLDRNVRAGLPPELEAPLLRAPSTSMSAASLRSFTMPSTSENDGPCYRGVALPKDLLSIFPTEDVVNEQDADILKGASEEGKEGAGGLEMVDEEEAMGEAAEVDVVGERGPVSWWRMGIVRDGMRRRRRHGRKGGSGIYGASFGELLEELRETGEEDESELEDAQEIGGELDEGGVRVVGTSIDSSASSSSSSSPSSSVSMGEGWVWRAGGGHRSKRGTSGGEVSVGPHRPDRCLACCVKLLGQQRRNTRRSRDVSTGSCRNRTESSGEKYLVSGERESPVARRRKGGTLSMIPSGSMSVGNAVTRASDASCSSIDIGNFQRGEEIEDDGEGSNSKSVIRKEILKYIMRMSNPLWWKLSRQTLLLLKQKHPQSFQDVCLYSEVSACLGSASYRLISRHFIQELFFDLTFDELYDQSANILHLTESSAASAGASGTSGALPATPLSASSPRQAETGQVSTSGSENQSQSHNSIHSPNRTSSGSSNAPPTSHVQMSPSGVRTISGLPSLAEEDVPCDNIRSSVAKSSVLKDSSIPKANPPVSSQSLSSLDRSNVVCESSKVTVSRKKSVGQGAKGENCGPSNEKLFSVNNVNDKNSGTICMPITSGSYSGASGLHLLGDQKHIDYLDGSGPLAAKGIENASKHVASLSKVAGSSSAKNLSQVCTSNDSVVVTSSVGNSKDDGGVKKKKVGIPKSSEGKPRVSVQGDKMPSSGKTGSNSVQKKPAAANLISESSGEVLSLLKTNDQASHKVLSTVSTINDSRTVAMSVVSMAGGDKMSTASSVDGGSGGEATNTVSDASTEALSKPNAAASASDKTVSSSNVPCLSEKCNVTSVSGNVSSPPQVPTSMVLSELTDTCSNVASLSPLVATKTSSLTKPTSSAKTLPCPVIMPTLNVSMRSSSVSQPAQSDEKSNIVKRRSLEKKLVNR
ncbi:rapamycin-insensitive companion of mTOR isoform X2 [Ischnura elegans]|uniref:rapamycin-insensitive companion of mTOR isoform X2 n=1 Tax=Ischnura elegans TaxID=197161 RepID=UPI001ED8B3D5|nr:rapamycin-insensitive companion of mTOR isoform X2 [Ischnura elegans]